MRPYGGDDSLVQPVGTMPCCGGTWTSPPLGPMLAWEIGEPRGHLLHHHVLQVHEMQIGTLCLGLVLTFGGYYLVSQRG